MTALSTTARSRVRFAAALLIALSIAHARAQTPAPSNPTPLDGATGVAVAGPLTWGTVPMAESYDLRLGTSPAASGFSADRIAPQPMTVSYMPATLSAETTYYWRVIARVPGGQVTGPVWSFTTAGPAPKSAWDFLVNTVLVPTGLVGLALALMKYITDRNSRATDVLLKLEDEFHRKCEKGRPLIEYDHQYATKKVALQRQRDGRLDLTDIDNLLRFYVVLYAVRQAHQVPDRSLRTAYRFWLGHYYLKSRKELRDYIYTEFPTLQRWLIADLTTWTRFKDNPWSSWWRPFFTPADFVDDPKEELVLDRAVLKAKPIPLPARSERDLRVLVLTGAGISADSGIPTFRGPDGYWRSQDTKELATRRSFHRQTAAVWEWYRMRRERIRASKPNAAHEAITRLGLEVPSFLLVTQNVDDLHTRATWQGRSLPPDKIVKIHGDIFTSRCERCGFATPCEHCGFARGDTEDAGPAVPPCPRCGAALRPGVVWFDEDHDPRDEQRVKDFLSQGPCDVALVVGTSVAFDYILNWATQSVGPGGELIEINPEETRLSAAAGRTLREPAMTGVPKVVDELLQPLQDP